MLYFFNDYFSVKITNEVMLCEYQKRLLNKYRQRKRKFNRKYIFNLIWFQRKYFFVFCLPSQCLSYLFSSLNKPRYNWRFFFFCVWPLL